ncbi:MFS transporter [Kiloniella laminariae]|uniref:MFS transporter n=1 Tax=Kiloniella laminariae TaxID=454162 RepID=UPI0003818BBF|nr:MFS transporter [Kiloniella laminariae]
MSTSSLGGIRNTFSTLQSLPEGAKLLLLGICASRFAAYMIWPFIAVIMYKRFGTPITEIGAQLSIAALLSISLSPLAGMLGDRFNSKILMLTSCGLVIFCFSLMAFQNTPASYFTAIILSAIAHSFLEPLLRARLGETIPESLDRDDQTRAFLFHIRYYLVNLAVAIGPILGAWFADRDTNLVFLIAGLAYFLLAICILLAKTAPRKETAAQSPDTPGITAILKAALSHRLFLAVLFVNFLLVFVYAQNEDPLTFYLVTLEVQDINQIIALINFTNTAVVLVFHLFLMGWLVTLDEKKAYALALIFLMIAEAIIAANVGGWMSIWLLAIGCATLAEIVVMPLFTVMIDKMAPSDMRNSFFGISMLSGLGAAIAPFTGALVINHYGGVSLFAGLALMCIPVGCIGYRILQISLATKTT